MGIRAHVHMQWSNATHCHLIRLNTRLPFQVAATVHSGPVWRRRPAGTTRPSTPSPAPRGSGSVWAQSRPQCNQGYLIDRRFCHQAKFSSVIMTMTTTDDAINQLLESERQDTEDEFLQPSEKDTHMCDWRAPYFSAKLMIQGSYSAGPNTLLEIVWELLSWTRFTQPLREKYAWRSTSDG